jgi:hypothetical protein
MQRINPSGRRRPRSHESLQRNRQPGAPPTIGNPSAPGITTLAPAFVQALPSLGSVPSEYNHEVNAELLYKLGAVLAERGFGSPETWKKCDGNPIVFAQHSIMSAIRPERGDLLRRNVDYHLEVSDVVDPDGYGSTIGNGNLAVTIECGSAGYLKIGPALDALEQQAAGLGAAFYWTLVHTLYRMMRIYDLDDAMQYEERLIESANDDDEENRDQYEFPEVEKAIPECVRNTLGDKWQFEGCRALLRAHKCGSYRNWISRLRNLDRLSRLHLRQTREYLEARYYDGPPLPSLLMVFKEGDAITFCFDEEGQYMLEGAAEPALCVVFSPDNADQVEHALGVVERFIRFNTELFELVEQIAEWEKAEYAGSDSNRGEPSLRAA